MSNDKSFSGDPEYRGPYDEYLKGWNRNFTKKHLKAVERIRAGKAKQLVGQPGAQSVKEKLQQQLQAVADLKSQIAVFQNADDASTASTKTTSITTNNTDKISDEQYQTTIIQKMIAHIKSKG